MIFDSLFERRGHPENPSTPLSSPDAWLWDALGGRRSAAGVAVNEQTAMALSAVYSCVQILASTLGQVPLHLYRRLDRGRELVRDDQAGIAVSRRPNARMTSITWRETGQGHAALWGNSYHWIDWGNNARPRGIYPLFPNVTVPELKAGRLVYRTQLDNRGKRVNVELDSAEVLHIPALGFDGLKGYSPIQLQREQLGAAMATQEYSARFFGGGAHVGGLITFPNTVNDKAAVREAWAAAHSGADKAFRTAVLDQGAQYNRIGIPPEDAQFLETRKFQAEEIAAMFRIPPHMIARLDKATFSNIEHQSLEFVMHTMLPWFVRWEQELDRKLLGVRAGPDADELFFRFNLNGLLRGDQKSRFEAYHNAIADGWMTRNEARELEELNPLDGLDEPLQPLNMATVGDEPEDEPETDPEPAQGGQDDEPEDEPADDEAGDARARVIALRAAERLLRKEAKAVRSILEKHDGAARREAVADFYTRHRVDLAESLDLPETVARAYARARVEQMEAADDPAAVVNSWSGQAGELAEMALKGGV